MLPLLMNGESCCWLTSSQAIEQILEMLFANISSEQLVKRKERVILNALFLFM